MKRIWKIGLWAASGLIISSSLMVPITSCVASNKPSQPSQPNNPSDEMKYLEFKNQDINYYKGINIKDDMVDWVDGILRILIDQGMVEASQNAKLSSWNKNVNEKLYTNPDNNSALKNIKLTKLYSINVSENYPIAGINIDIGAIFNSMFNNVGGLNKAFNNVLNTVLLNFLETLKKEYRPNDKKVDKEIEKLKKNEPIELPKPKDQFHHIGPSQEDLVYKILSTDDQKINKYRQFNMFNDHLNLETNYLFDRYIFFHQILSLIYKNGYKKEDINFISIKSSDFTDAIKRLFITLFTDWYPLIKLMLKAVIESIPITIEVMLLEDLHMRLKRWSQEDKVWNIPEYKKAYEHIDNRLNKQLLPKIDSWIRNSFSISTEIDFSEIIQGDVLNDYIKLRFKSLKITHEEFNGVMTAMKKNNDVSFKVMIGIDLSFIYKMLCSPLCLLLLNIFSNPGLNIVMIFQLIIDALSKAGINNLDFINRLRDWIVQLVHKGEDIINQLKKLIDGLSKWFNDVMTAIKNDKDGKLGIKEKISKVFKLISNFKENIGEIKKLLQEINELIKIANGGKYGA